MKLLLTLRKGWDIVAEGEVNIKTAFLAGGPAGVNRNHEAQAMMFEVERAINAKSGLRATLELPGKRTASKK